jgi:hypothetical protein
MPSKQGLIQDENHPVRCAECSVESHLHYDSEAEASAPFCSILADEIVTARHPDHSGNVVLDLAPRDRGQGRRAKVVWSIRIPLGAPLKQKPDVP